MSTVANVALLCVIVCLTASCEKPPLPGAPRNDSMASSARDEQRGAPFALVLVEEARLPRDSAAANAAQLSTVDDVAIASDGTVIVPQRVRLVYLASDGGFVRSVGEKGSGPGEFREIRGVGWLGDTLWAYDGFLRRVTFLDQQGNVLAVVSMPENLPAESRSVFMGLLEGRRRADKVASRADSALPVRTLLRSWDGSGARVVAEEIADRNGITIRIGSRRFSVPQPFADQPLTRVSRDGRSLVIVERVASSSANAEVVVRWLDRLGNVRLERRYARLPRELTSAVAESTLAAISDAFTPVLRAEGDLAGAARFDAMLRPLLYTPTTMPLVFNALPGEDGVLLLQTQLGRNSWMLLAGDGSHPGHLELPADVRLLTADLDHVWGVASGDDGVPTIRRYRIVRGPTS